MKRNEFKEKVDLLDSLTNKDEITRYIQDLMKDFLLNFEIEIKNMNSKCNNLRITPLLIEAYFYKESIYEDRSVSNNKKICHCKDEQKNHFMNKLHFHVNSGNHNNRNGVDVCLSTSDGFFFSFLIKMALVTDLKTNVSSVVKQSCLADVLNPFKEEEFKEEYIKEKEIGNYDVCFVRRINIDCEDYSEFLGASVLFKKDKQNIMLSYKDDIRPTIINGIMKEY